MLRGKSDGHQPAIIVVVVVVAAITVAAAVVRAIVCHLGLGSFHLERGSEIYVYQIGVFKCTLFHLY